jgi:hypothetical protein
MYLAANTRPDMAYAVHQAAIYTHDQRSSHAVAIKRILRYIKGTKGQGIYFTPDGTEKMLNHSHSRNPRCAPAWKHIQIQAPREPPN